MNTEDVVTDLKAILQSSVLQESERYAIKAIIKRLSVVDSPPAKVLITKETEPSGAPRQKFIKKI